MATSEQYIKFVCDQISGGYTLRYKKMFGEYMLYINEKPILLVCDNTVYIKKFPEISEIMKYATCGLPYDGAKEHYIVDIDNRDLLMRVISVLEPIVPTAKNKK